MITTVHPNERFDDKMYASGVFSMMPVEMVIIQWMVQDSPPLL